MAEFEGATTERDLHVERRKYARAAVTLAIRELRPERHILCATSVSVGGVYCPNAAPRPAGTRLLLELDLPDGSVRAATARISPLRGRSGFAIEFDQRIPEFEVFLSKKK